MAGVEALLVGIEKPKEDLVSFIQKESRTVNVVAVQGMGGLGKTTLVSQVYRDERVQQLFQHLLVVLCATRCYCW